MNDKIIEENHENSRSQINANSENENIPMNIVDKSMKVINVNNKINTNLENDTKELLKSKRTHKFYDGWLQSTELKDCLEKKNKMR